MARTTRTKTTEATEAVSVIPKSVDLGQYITVRNGFQGKLVYQSKKTGEVFIWDEFGDEQEMELLELKNAKNSNKSFFEHNWFMFDDEHAWVIDFLGVGRYYENAIQIEDFDEIFSMKSTDLKKVLESLSDGQKSSVAYRAMDLIAEKKIDSMSVIETLESCLGIELIER